MSNLISKCVKMISGSQGGIMPVYKYQTKDGTKWYVKSDNLTKRGFNSRKEALQFEKEYDIIQPKHLPLFKVVAEDYLYTKKSSDITYGSIIKIERAIYDQVLPLTVDKPIDCYTLHDCRDFKMNLRKQNPNSCTSTLNYVLRQFKAIFKHAMDYYGLEKNPCTNLKSYKKTYEEKQKKKEKEDSIWTPEEFEKFIFHVKNPTYSTFFTILFYTGIRLGDDDDKIRLNQRKPSKYKGLSRFGPENNLQRINKFMKERPIFYKNLIQMKENFRFYLRCFYCITKVVILQFNSKKQDRISS